MTVPLLQTLLFETIFRYTFMDNNFGRAEIPFTHGLQTRVIFGGLASGSIRSIIETPLEYAKIKRQTHNTWLLKDSYTVSRIPE